MFKGKRFKLTERREALKKEASSFNGRWKAKEKDDGRFNLYREVATTYLGETPKEDKVNIEWAIVRPKSDFGIIAPPIIFDNLEDVEKYIKKEVTPKNIIYFDSNGDRQE